MTAPGTASPLIDNLRSAVAAELTTLPTYLYAAWSIRPIADGGSNAAVEAKQVIMSVVMEEMLHFGLASNILNAVGGEPDFTSVPYFPAYPCHLLRSLHHDPPGWGTTVRLLPLCTEAVQLFLQIELPEWDDPGGPTLAEFYDDYVKAYLPADDAAYGHGRQLPTWDNPGPGRLMPIASRADAEAAIDEILEQGEGLTSEKHDDGDHELAHYWKFKQVESRIASGQIEVDKDVYPIVPNPSEHVAAYTPEQAEANEAFNHTYTKLLTSLQETLAGDAPDVFPEATGLMNQLGQKAAVLRALGEVPGTDRLAGPTFELVD